MRKFERKIIWFSVLAGLFFWVVDGFYDFYYVRSDESFLNVLLYDLPTHGLFIRPIVIILFIALGCFLARSVKKSKLIETRYRELYDNINDCTFVFPFSAHEWKAKFTEVNVSACSRWGYNKEELLQLSLRDLFLGDELPKIAGLWARLKAGKHLFFETVLITKGGGVIPVEINAHIISLEDQPHVLAMVRDVSVRKQGEEEIRRLASFPQLDPNPILEVDVGGGITYANIAAQETLKRLGVTELESFLPEDLPEILQEAHAGGASQFYREKTIKGALFKEFIHFVPQYQVIRLFPADITVSREADNALRQSEQQLRTLMAQLLSIQETERRRISSELHDELGQALIYLKLQMAAVQAKMGKDHDSLKKDCGNLLHYLDGIIENVRRLSWNLSPTILEELGLASAMKYWLEEFGKHYKVQNLSVDIEEIDDMFSPKVQLNIYRIFQECLTNIGKHAYATQISLAVRKDDGQVVFTVKDNGQGFDVDAALSREPSSKGIGLATMAERVRLVGGALEIHSAKESGAQITFTIPTDTRRKPGNGPKDTLIPDYVRR